MLLFHFILGWNWKNYFENQDQTPCRNATGFCLGWFWTPPWLYFCVFFIGFEKEETENTKCVNFEVLTWSCEIETFILTWLKQTCRFYSWFVLDFWLRGQQVIVWGKPCWFYWFVLEIGNHPLLPIRLLAFDWGRNQVEPFWNNK